MQNFCFNNICFNSVQLIKSTCSLSTKCNWINPILCSSLNHNQFQSLLQIPCRYARSKEVKKYYSETGEYNPPVQDVIDRFKRLNWGAFIHARAGRKRHLYRRSEAERERRAEHILTNRATSFLLDNMLNEYWRRPKFYPEDIYEPYHKRTGVPWDYKLRKPKFFP